MTKKRGAILLKDAKEKCWKKLRDKTESLKKGLQCFIPKFSPHKLKL